MTVSGIELELQEVSEVQQKKREERQTYLTRLMRQVSKVEDDIWGSLSKDAQDWNNEAATAFKEGREIDDFLVEDEEPEEEENSVEGSDAVLEAIDEETFEDDGSEEEEPEVQNVVPEVPTKSGSGRSKESDKPKEPEHQPGMRTKIRGKNTSACHTIKRMVVKKPHITVDEITSKLKALDLKVTPVTISTLRSSVRDTLRVLNEEGLGTFKLNDHSAD
jgi:hypothetical protein